ncbi:stage III sporulation protein AF [Thalassobacillus sp. CUG 92003]|uniref:stage III sporulation protein AF n=1 Tax=Thalassobacillus sp. CUG 92003 TaxID=2736641 RepID=UPI0015E6FFD8|nr:stage III sporulation protein AF [Thalassobacillus sp. CUG 92003]
MTFLTQWLTQVVLFLLLAMTVDMILPSGSLKKYARLVIGLLLILVLLDPLFSLFQIRPQEITNYSMAALNQITEEEDMEESIEKKKNEILVQQDAYKLEQVKQALHEKLETPLSEEWDLQLNGVDLTFKEPSPSTETLEKLIVTVSETEGAGNVSQVEIDIDSDESQRDNPEKKGLVEWLAKELEMDQEIIDIHWEDPDE